MINKKDFQDNSSFLYTSLTQEIGEAICVNKPLHWTSFDIVKKLKCQLKIKKIGHAGTLDPLATGLLILCTGKQTKEISSYQDLEKKYQGTIVIGKTTPSRDIETDFDTETPYQHITESIIRQVSQKFVGYIDQIPPCYSAVKINGERAYKKVRKGQSMTLSPKKVWIKSFEITSWESPTIHFTVTCGKGCYIRSLAHDFGQSLGVGAYLSSLIRVSIGPYSLQDAYEITDFADNKEV